MTYSKGRPPFAIQNKLQIWLYWKIFNLGNRKIAMKVFQRQKLLDAFPKWQIFENKISGQAVLKVRW